MDLARRRFRRNTSANVRSEPIVRTREDAFRCFMGSDIDALAVGNRFLGKEEQDPKLRLDNKDRFELDWRRDGAFALRRAAAHIQSAWPRLLFAARALADGGSRR